MMTTATIPLSRPKSRSSSPQNGSSPNAATTASRSARSALRRGAATTPPSNTTSDRRISSSVAIFENRLNYIDDRRSILIAQLEPHDIRSWVECYVLPLLEQGEIDGSHYMSFIAAVEHQVGIFETPPRTLPSEDAELSR